MTKDSKLRISSLTHSPAATPETHFSRRVWIEKSQFTPHTGETLFVALEETIQKTKQLGMTPVILLDLDSTLYDTSLRNHVILNEWLTEKAPREPIFSALKNLTREVRFYSMADLFGRLGLSLEDEYNKAQWEDLKEYWRARFFTDPYVSHDEPYAGSSEFVREVYGLGAVLAYLTGRDAPGMEQGTRKALARDGFPVPTGKDVHLFMKPAREGDDYLYKMGEVEKIARLGEVVASFENEPKNFIGICKRFPNAIHVFVDSVCSDHPALPAEEAYLLESWLISRSRTRS